MSKTESEPVGVSAETFDLMDWIESGTIGRRQVTIYNDVAAGDRLVEIDERLTELGYGGDADPEADGPLAGSSTPEVTALLAEAEQVRERLADSKSVWTVRALAEDEVEDTFDPDKGGVPEPKLPIPPPEKAGRKAQEDWVDRVNAHRKAVAAAEAERRLRMIAAAVIAVETSRGRVERDAGDDPIMSVDQLRSLRSRPHGGQWIARLYEAVDAATEGDVEVPRPTSPGRSTSDLG